MPEPIHLKICGACNTGIPEEARVCPECGAPQGTAGRGARGPDPGTLLRPLLGQNLGCLVTAALPVFGIPLIFGAMLGNALGGLAIPLIGIGALGLLATGVLIWLVRPRR